MEVRLYKKHSWHKMDGKNEKSMLKLANLPSLRPLALKREFLLEFKFLKTYKDLYGKCCWWARSAHQQHFPYKSFKFPKTSTCHKNSLCNVRSLKLGHFHIFDMLFSFLASVLYLDCFWWLTRSLDHVIHAKSLLNWNFFVSLIKFNYQTQSNSIDAIQKLR